MSCGDSPGGVTPPSGNEPTFSILPALLDLDEGSGGSLRLSGSASGGGGTGQPPTAQWWSDDPTVASVDEGGNVSAISEGVATIYAQIGTLRRSAKVTVHRRAPGNTQIALPAGETAEIGAVEPGSSRTLRVRVTDPGGQSRANATVSWAITAGGGTLSSISSVSGTDGVAETVWSLGNAAGVGHVTAMVSANQRVDFSAHVEAGPAATVQVSNVSSPVAIGESVALSAEVRDAFGNVRVDASVDWSSGDAAIATVTEAGLVTGRAAGTVPIFGHSGEATGSTLVAVDPPEEPEPPTPGTLAIVPAGPIAFTAIGDALSLEVVAEDGIGSPVPDPHSVWTSDSPAVVSVDPSGRITALSVGAATVTARSDCCAMDQVTVTVSQDPASIHLGPNSAQLEIGESIQAEATVRDRNGYPIAEAEVEWSSEDTEVATVDASGRVDGVGPGSTTISATSGKASQPMAVSVSQSAAAISVTPPSLEVELGESVPLSAQVVDGLGNPMPGAIVVWSSNDAQIATVNENGMVTAAGPGATSIVATVDGVQAAAAVTVTRSVTQVAVAPNPLELELGASATLTVEARDALGNPIAGGSTSWSSQDTGIATVDTGGQVAATGTGTTSVTVAVDGIQASATVQVTRSVAQVTISPGSSNLEVGETVNLSAQAFDAVGNPMSGQSVSWSSTSTGVATVNSSGRVDAVGTGSASIRATVDGVQASASVTVSDPPPPPPPPPPTSVDTIFFEDFESGNLSAWDDGYNANRHRILQNASGAVDGSRYLEMTYPEGQDGGWLTKFFMPGYDSVYVSYYVKLEGGWQGPTKLGLLYGNRTDNPWSGFGQAGICPNGTDFFLSGLVTWGGSPGPTYFYSYWPDMNREPDGVTCWGRFGDPDPIELTTGVWHKVEYWLKVNDPGSANGFQQFWIDGVLYGTWSGLEFRTSNILKINAFQISANAANGSPQLQHSYIDQVLIVGNGKPGGL